MPTNSAPKTVRNVLGVLAAIMMITATCGNAPEQVTQPPDTTTTTTTSPSITTTTTEASAPPTITQPPTTTTTVPSTTTTSTTTTTVLPVDSLLQREDTPAKLLEIWTTTTTTPPTTTTTTTTTTIVISDHADDFDAGTQESQHEAETLTPDPNSDHPNGIPVEQLFPNGIPNPPEAPTPERLYEHGLHVVCDGKFGVVIANSHRQFKEPYVDCEWATKWYAWGCHRAAEQTHHGMRNEVLAFFPGISLETAEAELAEQMAMEGVPHCHPKTKHLPIILCWDIDPAGEECLDRQILTGEVVFEYVI